ncbi:MAG: helix-turn-helix domain-containing protein [Pseudobdellovibrio sp.]
MDHISIKNIKDLGKIVRDVRKNKHLTQEDLAARTGVSRRFIYQLENGSRDSFPIGKILQVLKRMNLEVSISSKLVER